MFYVAGFTQAEDGRAPYGHTRLPVSMSSWELQSPEREAVSQRRPHLCQWPPVRATQRKEYFHRPQERFGNRCGHAHRWTDLSPPSPHQSSGRGPAHTLYSSSNGPLSSRSTPCPLPRTRVGRPPLPPLPTPPAGHLPECSRRRDAWLPCTPAPCPSQPSPFILISLD